MMLPNKSGCYICNDCPNHLVNQKFGYVIPCKEKSNCGKYMTELAAHKAANVAESKSKALNYPLNTYKKKRR